ncbi:MAG: hypothetical protein ACE361_25880 [Aureliella sp.]
MKKFHPIRTAVTIGLIITMMIQPMVAIAAAPMEARQTKPERAQTATSCDGCGCCEVQSPDQRCCCCGGSEDSPADSPPTRGDQTTEVEGHPQASLLGVCLCGVMVPPMDRGDRCPQRIIVRHVAVSEAAADQNFYRRSKVTSLRAAPPCEANLVARYSQRFLCMWLI